MAKRIKKKQQAPTTAQKDNDDDDDGPCPEGVSIDFLRHFVQAHGDQLIGLSTREVCETILVPALVACVHPAPLPAKAIELNRDGAAAMAAGDLEKAEARYRSKTACKFVSLF